MGWVATVACALIFTMFLTGWLNRDDKPSQKPPRSISERDEKSSPMQNGRVTQSEKGSGDIKAQEKPDQKEKPASTQSSQPATIVIDVSHVDDQTSEDDEGIDVPQINIQSQPEPQSTGNPSSLERKMATATPSAVMPPPPLPSSKPSSTTTSNFSSTTRSQSPPRLKPPTFGRPPTTGGNMRPPPSTASTLRAPPPPKVLSNARMAPSPSPSNPSPSPSPSTSTLNPRSRQVTLTPGHSPLDWAALTNDPTSTARLRGKDVTHLLTSSSSTSSLLRITPSQLKTQNGRKGRDAWTVFQGKVYNLTPYVPFHPGGKGEILRGAGRDSAALFMEVHPWVNWDGMLAECCIGILVGEDEAQERNELDEMD